MSESTDNSESERRAALVAEIMRSVERIATAVDTDLKLAGDRPVAYARPLYPVRFFAALN